IEALTERRERECKPAGLGLEQMSEWRSLRRMLGRRESRTFEEIQDQRRLVAVLLASLACGVQILSAQRWIARDLLLGVALHERVVEPPPGQAEDWHPDQFLLDEELEERRLATESPHQHDDVVPALVIGADQILRLRIQRYVDADFP